ncbi:MAG: peptidase M28, partial [Mucilaginibacter sp.]
MKKTLAALAFMAISAHSFGQDVNKLIDQDDVTRIIKTLSADDMQGRATFTPGIEKAAQFIESEYTKAGLKPLEGNTGYRQNFTMVRSTPVKTTASINGKPVPADSLFTVGTQSFTWANDKDVQIVNVSADKNFRQEYVSAQKSGKKTLMIVDPKFQSLFKRAHDSYSMRGSVSFKGATTSPVTLVLGKFDNITSFEVNYENKTEELPLFNVAGMIPGKTKPNE